MKYRITMWNPDAEEKSKVVQEEVTNGNSITEADLRRICRRYLMHQPIQTIRQRNELLDTMLMDRGIFFPITLTGSKIVMHANNDDYTEYLFERLE